jgi:hypothetical protein
MHFEQTTITIATNQGKKSIPAFVAPDTGLAYHRMGDEEGYVITHLQTGLTVGGAWYAESEAEVQCWLETILPLADWLQPIPQPSLAKRGTLMKLAIIGALSEACETVAARAPEMMAIPVLQPLTERQCEVGKETPDQHCQNPAHWQFNGKALCLCCMQQMSDNNSDNEEAFRPALSAGL